MNTIATTYAIRVNGHLDDHWSTWLGALDLTRSDDGTTTITVSVADQAQLHGVLAGLRDIGAVLTDLRTADAPTQVRSVLARPLHTERLTLRPATADDTDATWKFRQLACVNEWLTGCPSDRDGYRELFTQPGRLATMHSRVRVPTLSLGSAPRSGGVPALHVGAWLTILSATLGLVSVPFVRRPMPAPSVSTRDRGAGERLTSRRRADRRPRPVGGSSRHETQPVSAGVGSLISPHPMSHSHRHRQVACRRRRVRLFRMDSTAGGSRRDTDERLVAALG